MYSVHDVVRGDDTVTMTTMLCVLCTVSLM